MGCPLHVGGPWETREPTGSRVCEEHPGKEKLLGSHLRRDKDKQYETLRRQMIVYRLIWSVPHRIYWAPDTTACVFPWRIYYTVPTSAYSSGAHNVHFYLAHPPVRIGGFFHYRIVFAFEMDSLVFGKQSCSQHLEVFLFSYVRVIAEVGP